MYPAFLLLMALTAVRLGVAAVVPLAPDEAYYWVWSRALQPGYLDHPPMVAMCIRIGTALAGETALGVRLLAPLGAAVGSLLLADAAERLYPGRKLGVPAAALLNATVMVGAGVVTMTPDTPLLFYEVLGLWALVRAGAAGRGWWLAVGAAAGAAAASKYTGGLVGVAAPVWLAWMRRWRAFGSAWLWAGGLVAALVFAPVVVWNAQHGWVSFLKQGGRTAAFEPARAAQFLGELVAGQAGLATPPIAALFAAGLWRAVAGAWRRAEAEAWVAALVVPGALLFGVHAVGDRVQANWLALLYPPLAIAGAAVGAGWWRGAAWFGLVVTGVVYLQAATGWLPVPGRLDPTLMRLSGWGELAREAEAMRAASGLSFVAAEEYSHAAELAWAAPPGAVVVGADPRWRLVRLQPQAASPGLLLLSQRRREEPDPALWREAVRVGDLVRRRGGVEAERFRVYRVALRTGAAAAILPRPGGE